MKVKYSNTYTRKAMALTTSDVGFTVTATPRDHRISSSGQSDRTDRDANLRDYTPAVVDHEYDISATSDVILNESIVWESLNTGIASVDIYGHVTRIADGLATIVGKTSKINRGVRVVVSRQAGTAMTSFLSWVSGSLGEHCGNSVDALLIGKTPSAAEPIFSVQDHDASVYVRNTNCWGVGLDLTCLSPWNSDLGPRRAGTLISPRHFLAAWHYRFFGLPGNPKTLRFITASNQVVERQVVDGQRVGTTDAWVGVLDSDVPNSISFAKLLPANAADYLPGVQYGVPLLCLDQEEKASVADLCQMTTLAVCRIPVDSQRLAFFEDKIVGDSGNPGFVIINSEPILVTTWTAGPAGAGTNLSAFLTGINSAMTSLGGGYQATTVDLSAFPSY